MIIMRKTLKIYYHHLLPKKFLTNLAHFLANSKITWLKNYLISDFLKKHPVNMQEAKEPNPLAYASFNDFFTRHLSKGVRVFAKTRYISPVDGAISESGKIQKNKLIQAKGIDYRIEDLIVESKDSCTPYYNGSFMTIYLSPIDYHRVHMPITGKLVKQTYIPGKLYSVQPFTTENIPNIFSENERLVLHFETNSGPFILVLVGATIVGCMGTSWQGDLKRQNKIDSKIWSPAIEIKQGEEVGYFKLGSTVILLWPESANPEWVEKWNSGKQTRLGQAIAN